MQEVPADSVGTTVQCARCDAGFTASTPAPAAPKNVQPDKPAPSGGTKGIALPKNLTPWIAVGVFGALLSLVILAVGAGLGIFCISQAQERPRREGPFRAVFQAHEIADTPRHKPFDVDPALQKAEGKVFLSDLKEFAWQPGPQGWSFGKNGQLGSMWVPNGRVIIQGVVAEKALSMHPPERGYTRVCYALGRNAKSLQGAAAISEDELLAAAADSVRHHGRRQSAVAIGRHPRLERARKIQCGREQG